MSPSEPLLSSGLIFLGRPLRFGVELVELFIPLEEEALAYCNFFETYGFFCFVGRPFRALVGLPGRLFTTGEEDIDGGASPAESVMVLVLAPAA